MVLGAIQPDMPLTIFRYVFSSVILNVCRQLYLPIRYVAIDLSPYVLHGR